MAQSFSESLKPEPQKYSLTPANGYALVGLKISLNAEEINADYPSWIENELLFSINYLNNPLKVFTSKNGYNGKFQLINWYGQVIEVKTNIPFGFLYEITTGRPIELQAPIRTGVICDQKWTQFQSFVVSHIADYFQHTIYTPKAIEVKAYNYLRQKYPSIPDCPYFVAEQILGYDEKYNESVVICEKIVLRYDGDEKLIYNYVKVERKDAEDEDDVEWLEYEGYESFVPLINEPVYVPVDYHQNSLKNKINKIYWRPGAKIVTNCSESVISFRHLEQFALATCLEEVKWQPITKDVYAIAYRSGGNLPDVEEWIIGCGSEPAVALTQYYFAGYRHDEHDESIWYKEQIDNCLIELQPNVIRANPSKQDLKEFIARAEQVNPGQISLVKITFNDDDDTATIEGIVKSAEDKLVVMYQKVDLQN